MLLWCFTSRRVINIQPLSRIGNLMAAVRNITKPGNNSKTIMLDQDSKMKTEDMEFSTKQYETATVSNLTEFTKTAFDLSGLTNEEKNIYFAHKKACEKGEIAYIDPETEYSVFTESFLKQRGSCCGNGCRHCPYNHVNVPPAFQTKSFNGAFYM